MVQLGTAQPVQHVAAGVEQTTTSASRGLNKTVTGATDGLKSTVGDTADAAARADILGVGKGVTGGLGETVVGTGEGLVCFYSESLHHALTVT
jgi:hypothetical protein